MPHLVILYSGTLEAEADMSTFCRQAADAMLAVRDDEGAQVFPTGGTRVLAYPSAHHAVADGSRDFAFVYLNLRMARGRSAATQQRAGDAILACAKRHFDPLMASRYIGITVQVDESPGQVYDGKHSNIHPLFAAP
jgi:5-carboxymethyl-2-hydroxymuconate isomerase